jgi:hypothetical protein
MIFATASSARPTVKDLTILASISVHYRHMMLRVLRRLRKALDTQYNKLIAQREAKYPRTPGRPETEGEQQLRLEARKRLTVAAHRIAMEDCQFIEFIVVVRWLEEWETDVCLLTSCVQRVWFEC